jgi:hypothetical protein
MTINCIPTSTHGDHICFQTINLYGCKFATGYETITLRMNSFYVRFCRHTKHVLRVCVFSVHNSHHWARDKPHALRERGYEVRFIVSFSAGIERGFDLGPYLLPERLTVQRYREFLEIVLLGFLEGLPLVVR